MYNYNDRVNRIKENIKNLQTFDVNKESISDVSKFNLSEDGYLGWMTKINVFVNTSKIPDDMKYGYQTTISLIQDEVTIATKGSGLKYQLYYHNDGLMINVITNYIQDVKRCFDLACYINTIIKLVSISTKKEFAIEMSYGIGLVLEKGIFFSKPKIKNVEINYSFISITDSSSVEKANYLSRVPMTKVTDGTMFMSKLFYDNILEVLLSENKKYKEWIKEEKDLNLETSYYSCNIIITEFNNLID